MAVQADSQCFAAVVALSMPLDLCCLAFGIVAWLCGWCGICILTKQVGRSTFSCHYDNVSGCAHYHLHFQPKEPTS